MRIIVARRRIRGTLPHFEYRVLIPFDQISIERQNLIHTRSDYGIKSGPWARTSEVIAPMAHLRMPPGLVRYEVGPSGSTRWRSASTRSWSAIAFPR